MKELFREGCPSWDRLAALHEDRLPPEESESLKRHLDACPVCRTEFAMLKDFITASASVSEAGDVERIARVLEASRTPKRRWWSLPNAPRWAAALTVLLVIIGAALQWQLRRPIDVDDFEESRALRSGAIVEVSPNGDFTSLPGEFTWDPVAGAVSYELVVTEVDGSELWRGSTSDRRIALPVPVARALRPLKTLVWQVTALDRTGSPLAQSQPVRIRYIQR